VTQNFNKLIGRYPGADGFKTGFICASGYNLVASATRDGRRLIAVVLGSSSGSMRAVRAAQMLDRGFGGNGLGWLKPSLGTVDQLAPIDASPPNLRDDMCSGKHKRPASDEDDTVASTAGESGSSSVSSGPTFFAAGLQPPLTKPSDLMAAAPAPSEPIPVYTGPTRTGAALIAAVAADADSQTVRHGKKAHGAKKLAATSEPKEVRGDAKSDAKTAGKPAAVRHANAKPDAKPAATEPAAAKPAKPKAAAKPKGDAKPAKSTSG
jgi:D-alanyl-D-alanine carboxypeptidase